MRDELNEFTFVVMVCFCGQYHYFSSNKKEKNVSMRDAIHSDHIYIEGIYVYIHKNSSENNKIPLLVRMSHCGTF